MEPLHESDTKHTGYRETKPMAKARNRMVQVADLLRSNGISRPPEAKFSPAADPIAQGLEALVLRATRVRHSTTAGQTP